VGVADTYRDALEGLEDWDEWLLEHSGLPGPRGNIELAQVVADLGGRDLFHRYLSWTPERAPVGSREEYLAFCGTVGLGRLPPPGRALDREGEPEEGASRTRGRGVDGRAAAAAGSRGGPRHPTAEAYRPSVATMGFVIARVRQAKRRRSNPACGEPRSSAR